MRGDRPYQRYQMALEKAVADNKDNEVLMALPEEEDKSIRDEDMKDKVLRLQKWCLERKKAVKKAKEKEKNNQPAAHTSFMRSNHDCSSN